MITAKQELSIKLSKMISTFLPHPNFIQLAGIKTMIDMIERETEQNCQIALNILREK